MKMSTVVDALPAWNHEEMLQDLLAEHPEIVSDRGEPLALIGREVEVGGRLDVAYLAKDASVVVVEAKLSRNRDYEGVIGQVMRYYDALRSSPSACSAALTDHFKLHGNLRQGGYHAYYCKVFGLERPIDRLHPDLEQLPSRIVQALVEGRIRLVIAADDFIPGLVEKAADASVVSGIDIRLVQVRRKPAGGASYKRIPLNPQIYRKQYRQPFFLDPTWERAPVRRMPIEAFRKAIHRDNYYGRHPKGHRVLEYEWPSKDFLCERGPGQAHKSPHQVDVSRPESYAPAMPCMQLLRETGNPFRPVWSPRIITQERYQPFVATSHHTWKRLLRDETITLTSDDAADRTIMEIMQASGVHRDARDAEYAPGAISQTLRDMALWGLVTHERRGVCERRFTLLWKPE